MLCELVKVALKFSIFYIYHLKSLHENTYINVFPFDLMLYIDMQGFNSGMIYTKISVQFIYLKIFWFLKIDLVFYNPN